MTTKYWAKKLSVVKFRAEVRDWQLKRIKSDLPNERRSSLVLKGKIYLDIKGDYKDGQEIELKDVIVSEYKDDFCVKKSSDKTEAYLCLKVTRKE